MINEDIYVTEVLMNRKISRFVAHAIEHYWESHYCDDEITWDDLESIYEHLREYGVSKVERLPCGKIICINPDEDAECETCEYNPEYNKKLCPELGRTCIGEKCSQIKNGVCQINPWIYNSSISKVNDDE